MVAADGTVTIQAAPAQVCDPVNGRLTADCLQLLASGAGCKNTGVVMDILSGDATGYYRGTGDPNFKYTKAVDILKTDAALFSDKAFFGDGVCARTDAMKYYSSLVSMITNGPTTRSKEAADFMVTGADFDPCAYDAGQLGPFDLKCMTRVAREKGCQPAGAAFPKRDVDYSKMTWTEFNAVFTKLVTDMSSTTVKTQMDATKNCLGVTIVPPGPDCGETNGCEVLWYSWNYDWNFPNNNTSTATYYGRKIMMSLPNFNTSDSNYNPYGRATNMAMKVQTQLVSPKTETAAIWLMSKDGVVVEIAGRPVIKQFTESGPKAYTSAPFALVEKVPVDMKISYFKNFGSSTFIPKIRGQSGGFDDFPSSLLRLKHPSGFPFARWDFYHGFVTDSNGVLGSTVMGSVPLTVLDGKRCARFTGGQNCIKITNPIAMTALKSITMMIYVNSPSAGYPRAWELNNNNGFTGSWCDDSLFGCLSPNNSNGIGFYCEQRCAGPNFWTGNNTIKTGKWTHVAWVLDDDMKGMTIYIDGNFMQRYANQSFNTLANKTYKNFYIFQSVERFAKDVGVAWFHVFDYPLDRDSVKMDMGLGFDTQENAAPTGFRSSYAPNPHVHRRRHR
jgi:hypothetical protein